MRGWFCFNLDAFLIWWLKIEAKTCANRVKGASEVYGMKGGEEPKKATTNQGVGSWVIGIWMKAVKYKGTLVVRVRSPPSVSVKWRAGMIVLTSTMSLLVNEAAHSFHAGRLHLNAVVCTVCVTHPSSSSSWLQTAAFPCLSGPASQPEIVPNRQGKESWPSVFSCPALLLSVTHGYK